MYQMCRIDMCEGAKVSGYLKAELKRLTKKILLRWDVKKIILYGSLARGDFNEGSDIDIIVVADFTERFHLRAGEILDLTSLPVEPVCYTEEEFEEKIRSENPFILAVIDEGIVLWSSEK